MSVAKLKLFTEFSICLVSWVSFEVKTNCTQFKLGWYLCPRWLIFRFCFKCITVTSLHVVKFSLYLQVWKTIMFIMIIMIFSVVALLCLLCFIIIYHYSVYCVLLCISNLELKLILSSTIRMHLVNNAFCKPWRLMKLVSVDTVITFFSVPYLNQVVFFWTNFRPPINAVEN